MSGYRKAIAWVAHNDDPTLVSVTDVATQITVVLIADLWHKEPEKVACDVIRYRIRERIG